MTTTAGEKLRFKDEQGMAFPEWEEMRINQALQVGTSNLQASSANSSGTYPLFDAVGLIGFTEASFSDNRYITIIKDGAGVGRIRLLDGRSNFIGTMNALSEKNSENIEFLYYLLEQVNFKKHVVGSGIPHIYFKDYGLELVEIPSLPEQQKIADFLTALDARITDQRELVELLEKRKKGMLQRVFSQQVRFVDADGQSFPEWRQKKLNETLQVGTSSLQVNSAKPSGAFPLYDAIGPIGFTETSFSENRYITIIKDGAGVGRIRILEGGSNFIGTMNALYVKRENSIDFLYYLLVRLNFKKHIVGSGIPHIYFKDYGLEVINVPSLPEQQKIADFFTALDEEIDASRSLLNDYMKQKQAALQGIFR